MGHVNLYAMLVEFTIFIDELGLYLFSKLSLVWLEATTMEHIMGIRLKYTVVISIYSEAL